MISEKYVFELTNVKGNKQKIQWELSYEKAKQRYLSLKKMKTLLKFWCLNYLRKR